ncbi:hypothetical protein SAMN02745121_03614 [Nannocystis exedens]|uniref:Uncharacterized protein n=1 Tax=Nannocystis exedens TaxID=54 RepID=A0A1I1Z3I4_9BACT|nr:hypothetical protein [Nannocystis exedens]PCC75178.1 hypothetical protein NAEX_08284 [Nannocystis exedens]SFE26311.1 hypothetical protein SAMN02745121_03614 [Nannocystis exedens]
MDPHVLDLGTHIGPTLVRRQFLDAHPRVGDALERDHARIVVFEPDDRMAAFFPAVQRALDVALPAVPADILPLFVALVVLPDLVAACGYDFSRTHAPVPPLVCPRGAFLGYIAIGEGGGLFFAADGRRGTPTPDAVLAVLARAAGRP